MNTMSKRKMKLLSIIIASIFAISLAGCGGGTPAGGDAVESQGTLTLADAGWDSIQFHNAVASFILKHAYGYDTEIITGSTPVTFAGHVQGDIDIYIEVWTDNIGAAYDEAIENGSILYMATNFDDNAQGLYVPRFVIEGDAERGIEPIAPGLRSITDLPDYWELFVDAENPNQGRIFGSPPGWAVDEILSVKVETYGLTETFEYFRPGSDAALSASIVRAYEAGEPIVAYYWEPTWIMGLYDMVLLEEPPFDQAIWDENFGTEFPPVPCTVTINAETAERVPEILEFLSNYETSSALTSAALAYMQENDANAEQAAVFFLREFQDVWVSWLPAERAESVLTALQ